MYYYSHHIGDFISDTSRLTDSQCMAYLRLIWSYYDTEKPLENDPESLAFKIGSNPADVSLILKHYFTLDGDFWIHDRCEKVITEYHSKADKARNSANARWKNANGMRTHSERTANASKSNANQEPITNNQEPILKDITQQVAKQDKPAKKTELDYSQWPNMPSEQTMTDWLAMRKKLKAPISQTVINRFSIELKKAKAYGYSVDQCLSECVTRGWRGFETQWLVNSSQNGQYKTAAEKAADRNAITFDYEKARDF